ncbi:MAG: 5'/3'-nucleotidase SurE [Spirochaetes bacterium GWD1_61_31]|nr:MAG: 5'/3'-nucleotidase SurE [Spirochaetes bacterium GWB1_60_80]OHD29617.1 MAG: 5'/3'-nucleotidase SurE [Spirochaetes bacterium GWC1_61_12]OHD37520.1 MAG: 5'/3'-nucleotidase SurE [Spirochaetes bacterium GWD1_61_31]OHD41970.1 MAG: 5'/3'-nucleotidase SurE [Spirochaetes bacterium GWE1_60_18]OHD61764.1 MAG: 5'/3'-nucleotidase SurE [Spirochaetes bacterium GWF1_60_12]
MRILLTNDDGYAAEGLLAMAKALSSQHDICIVAPDRERSAQSHAMTLRDPLVLKEHTPGYYSCSGTPVDCVLMVLHGAIPFIPELVVSGINQGPNLGTDLIYSGTAAAARQAIMGGIPGIAVSLADFYPPFQFTALATFVAVNLDGLLDRRPTDAFLNINASGMTGKNLDQLAWTFPCRRIYKDTLHTAKGSRNLTFCFYTDGDVISVEDSGSDEHAVRNGLVAVSAVEVYPRSCHVNEERNRHEQE